MITVTTTQTRLSTDTPFYISTAPSVMNTFAALIANNQALFVEPPVFTTQSDGLVHTTVAKYHDQAALDAFLALLDQALPTFMSDRASYSVLHNITVERVVS